ncbi:hypothetical protein GWI33_006069 [Rhynchophorus ferrugineus]|uniref:Uncharacterized protein n=1 Tax=Rhynchophorus ferrugineus TaxID=354439 RepID=A0A834MFQ7_RHYFE|nr:hypothetical protein GWI33_006069 [Rhynchophorus ferrugineus]
MGTRRSVNISSSVILFSSLLPLNFKPLRSRQDNKKRAGALRKTTLSEENGSAIIVRKGDINVKDLKEKSRVKGQP